VELLSDYFNVGDHNPPMP